MSLPDGFETGQSVQALDQNQQLLSRNGYGVISGGTVSIRSGTLGTGEATVEVASATLLVDGSAVAVSSATVAIEESSTRPRKDLVVYDPALSAGNRLTTITGLPAQADPTGATRQQAEQPAPPALGGAVDALSGSGEPKIPLAEIWVPSAVDAITADDILDRRQDVAPAVGSIDAAERVGIPVYAADGDAPNSTLYFNSSGGATKFKDASGTIHTNTGGSGVKTTLFMSDYVAASDRDGSVAVDSQFDTVISEADPHDTIVFDDGTYQLAAGHTITKPVTIDSSDATIRCTNTANNNAHILFEGGGIAQTTTTTAATDRGQRTLPVTDASLFASNDRVLVIAQSYTEVVNSHIHFDVVESIDTTNDEIALKGGLSRGFGSGVDVNQVDLLQSPAMRDITTEGGGNRHLQFRWCEDPLYENVAVSEYREVSLYTLDCWKARYRNVEATDPTGLGSGEGEPIALYRVQDAYIESPRVFDCRRGIDFSRGTRSVTIVDPVIRGVDRNGISVHQNDPADDISIIGGEIVCSQTGSVSAGAGITSADGTNMTIDGTTIIAREDGIIATGPTTISNVEIKPVAGVTGPQRSGIYVLHGSTHIDNVQITDPNGLFDFGVWVAGSGTRMEDIFMHVETRRSGPNHVYLDGRDGPIDDVTIRGTLDNLDGTSNHGIFVRADGSSTLNNIDISVTAEGFDEQAIRLLSGGAEQIANVNIHDCYFDVGLAAAFTDGNGSFGPIRVTDCNMNTGSTSLSFDDTISKLHVHGNTATGTIDDTGASQVYNEGNL